MFLPFFISSEWRKKRGKHDEYILQARQDQPPSSKMGAHRPWVRECSWKPSHTHDRTCCWAMMQSGSPPLYTSQALDCNHTQVPLLVSSRKTVVPLFPVFITGAGRKQVAQRLSWAPQGCGQVLPMHRSKTAASTQCCLSECPSTGWHFTSLLCRYQAGYLHHSSCRPQEHKGARPGLHCCHSTDLPQPHCPSLGCSPQHSPLTWLSAQYIMSAACTNWYPEPLLHSSSSV